MDGGDPLRRSLWTAQALDGLQRADHDFAFPRDRAAGRCRIQAQQCSHALLMQRDAVVVLQGVGRAARMSGAFGAAPPGALPDSWRRSPRADCPHCGVCGSLCSVVPAAIPPGAVFASRRVCLPPQCPVVQEARAAQRLGLNDGNGPGGVGSEPGAAYGRLKWRPPPPGSNGLVLLPTSPPTQDAASVVLHLVIPGAENQRAWREGMHAYQRAIAAACFGLVLASGALVSIPPSCGTSARFVRVVSYALPQHRQGAAHAPSACHSTIPSTSCVRVTMHTRVTVQGVVREDAVSLCPLARQGAARGAVPTASRTPPAAAYDATASVRDSSGGGVSDVAGCDAALEQLREMVLLPLLARSGAGGGGGDGDGSAALLADHVPAVRAWPWRGPC